MKRTALLLVLAQACALATAQIAQQPPAPGQRAQATFTCGGVGAADQQKMKSAAGQHDLMLTFSVSNGAYLADVDVEIGNKAGVVLSAKCDGPIMLVDLPSAGTWQVTARANGQVRQKTVTTRRGGHVQASLVWPAGA
jgi:hypothetical protein